ncbi:PhlB family protein [Aliihoeflea sp. PC F10.4]
MTDFNAGRMAEGARIGVQGAHCSACGTTTFPLTPFGCPHCGEGTERVSPCSLGDKARLLSAINIHVPVVPGIAVPFAVGEAELSDGIVVQVMLAGSASSYAHGQEIVARATSVEETAQGIGCRFHPVELS